MIHHATLILLDDLVVPEEAQFANRVAHHCQNYEAEIAQGFELFSVLRIDFLVDFYFCG